MRTYFLSLLPLLLVALSACHTVHVGDQDGGPTTGDGGDVVQCGRVTCDPGLVCCNASCGICTEPGLDCAAIACEDTCASNADCTTDEYCAFASGSCGGTDGVCQPRPDACPPTIREVCGCDGATYSTACDAAASGVNVARDGACSTSCGAQDARGEGDCRAVLGVVWNGERCETIGGCDCVGADCGDIYGVDEEDRCWSDHAACTSCAAQDAEMVGGCEPAPIYKWDGSACVGMVGCSCEGADCGALYGSPATCEAARGHCTPGGACITDADCGSGEWCRFAWGECGGTGDGMGECVGTPPPGWACDTDGPPVCGCDGTTYTCENHAHAFMTSVLHSGACPTTGPCEAMDAEGDGACLLFLGVKWNGSTCESLGGCTCVGADCAALYEDDAACRAATTGCDRPPGNVCGGFAGDTCRPDEYCDFIDPHSCGGADETGTCTARTTVCPDVEDPVCGCDGAVHSNACDAHAAGTDDHGEPGPSGSCGAP